VTPGGRAPGEVRLKSVNPSLDLVDALSHAVC
jgi:hypothetical protein